MLKVTEAMENFEQDNVAQLNSSPHYQIFDIDRRVSAETTLMPNGELEFSLNLFDLFGKLYFQSTTLDLQLPSCEFTDRDGLILLEVSTN